MNRRSPYLFMGILVAGITFAWASYQLPITVSQRITSTFGECRPSEDMNFMRFHIGLDLSTNTMENVRVLAMKEGYFWKYMRNDPVYGHTIFLKHPDGMVSVYAHLNGVTERFAGIVNAVKGEFGEDAYLEIEFEPDEFPVRKGEWIGLSGRTGLAMAPHCHVEIRDLERGVALNPVPFLRGAVDALDATLSFERIRIDGQISNIVSGGTYSFTSNVPQIEINARLNARTGTGRFGLNQVEFYLDGELLYHLRFDEIALDFVDYGDLVFGEGSNASNYWYKLYSPVTRSPVVANKITGMTRFPDLSHARIVIHDDWGNSREWSFRLQRR